MTIPANWTQVANTVSAAGGNNVTTNSTSGYAITTDYSRFNRNILQAWDNTTKTQIDDVIGAVKISSSVAGASMTYYNFYHQVQISTSNAVATGSWVEFWTSYLNFDGTTAGTTSWLNLQTEVRGTGSVSSFTYDDPSIGTPDLITLNGTYAAVKATFQSASYVPKVDTLISGIQNSGTNNPWVRFTQTNWNGATYLGANAFKAGDTVSYKVGIKVFPSSTATTTTTNTQSAINTWTLVDGANALAATTGLAAAIAMLSF
jgi:hypothetical protein